MNTTLLELCRAYLASHDIRDLMDVFTEYCDYHAIRKADSRRKNNANSYHVEYKSYNGAKCECMIFNDTIEWGNTRLYIVMRKHNGIPYLIIGKNNAERYVEVGIDTIWKYDETPLKNLISDYPQLFENMGIHAE